MNYFLKKDNNIKHIYYMKYDKVSDFENKFKKLATIILNYLYSSDDDQNSGDLGILLDEVERLKCEDLLEVKKNMEIAEYNKYLEKLIFLERELKQKQMMISFRESLNEELTNFKSR